MVKKIVFLALCISCVTGFAQQKNVRIVSDASGDKLTVNGTDFVIKGMNWDYFPTGTNYNYSLWKQPDDIIIKALDSEMSLLRDMGVNTIRQYTGVPPKWITYIYEKYGIYTILNHSFGRYGLTVGGAWQANTDYANAAVQKQLLAEVVAMVNENKQTPGLLCYLLGNENNYGLFWEGAETENIPFENRKSTRKAIAMYELFNQAALAMKKLDTNHPVAMCNGDLQFLDIIASKCGAVDIFGTNMYRGKSFGNAFEEVKSKLKKPILFTEFGSDAYNTIQNKEDDKAQADVLLSNWQEIFNNTYGYGKSNNCIGGCTFQFSDGWWKFGQTTGLDTHDTNASWSNGAYAFDFVKGENNMNEEWFGICAKGVADENGLYTLYPRSAYYALKELYSLQSKSVSKNATELDQNIKSISLTDAGLKYQITKPKEEGDQKIRLSRFTANFTTFNTGGSLITTPKQDDPQTNTYPNKLGFDHMESFFVGVEAKPASNISANVELNILGNVAENPIDEIFYENRGRKMTVETTDGEKLVSDPERVQVYRAKFSWNEKYFNLNGFYRTGHYHWGYEGDFFGLYPEANYGPNIDIYNGLAPSGFEIEGKKFMSGLKVAYGPQLWWGANPALLVKYSKSIANFNFSGMFHEDLEQATNVNSSFAVPQPKTRKATLHINRKIGKISVDLGGIWAGQPLNNRSFQLTREVNGVTSVYQDQINSKDNWGGKIKLTYTGGRFNWYGQGAIMGLVANGGADYTKTFTGWTLKDSGSGNQYNFLSGFTYSIGKLQIAPNFLWQKPIEGPISADTPAPARPRNILEDPFVVRVNRETVAGELLLTYDPTPGTWMYEWDNDIQEDAKFACSAGFVYRHLPTTQDAAIGILANGRTTFVFNGAPPAKDLWEAKVRIVSKLNPSLGIISNMYGGTAQSNGSDARTLKRVGMDIRVIYKKVKLNYISKWNDWGPFDYHRDFNLTYPVQQIVDLSTELGKNNWFSLPGTKIGIRGTYRTLNQYSPRYNPTTVVDANGNFVPDPTAIGFDNGKEWEIRTYIQINL
ncbi:glycoside hydrolase family 2 TIM barrel-domain containing protein [Flavobacterium sp. N1719]|uniref:glycoside hydrolase family 2 TIM barrel-domain containing protein n=1 Tax=Flavobacterium sp. N1719 TaxID=2885633 RepID=UPI002222A6A8|nr:glycoside hydrolase family 2 TIM barrel-domain containing protein [Flavobacterium sp. N1719]